LGDVLAREVVMTAGESIKKAAEGTKSVTEQVVDAVEDKIDDVTDAVQDAVQKAGGKVHEATSGDAKE
jgi:hypothetical protein